MNKYTGEVRRAIRKEMHDLKRILRNRGAFEDIMEIQGFTVNDRVEYMFYNCVGLKIKELEKFLSLKRED